MIRAKVEWPTVQNFDVFRRGAIQRAEGAALFATDKAIRLSQRNLRASFTEVGLKRARTVIGVTSDLAKGRGVKRYGAEGFSASGVQFQSARGERIDGLIESYGKGAVILPKRARWLWIATAELGMKRGGKMAGRKKITPAIYNASGYDRTIGPLVAIPGRNPNERLLIVKNVSTPLGGRRDRIRKLPRNGRPRGNREARDFIVAFVGIRRTERFQRFDAQMLLREAAMEVPNYVDEFLRRNR